MDSGDKATNKAMSAAFKYAAFQAFCIPTEGDNDADAHTPEVAPKQMAAAPRMSADAVSPILHSISAAPDSAALKQIAETDKYDLIVQDAVYFSPRIDITDKIIKALADDGKLPAQ
jgi:hypothetical protein